MSSIDQFKKATHLEELGISVKPTAAQLLSGDDGRRPGDIWELLFNTDALKTRKIIEQHEAFLTHRGRSSRDFAYHIMAPPKARPEKAGTGFSGRANEFNTRPVETVRRAIIVNPGPDAPARQAVIDEISHQTLGYTGKLRASADQALSALSHLARLSAPNREGEYRSVTNFFNTVQTLVVDSLIPTLRESGGQDINPEGAETLRASFSSVADAATAQIKSIADAHALDMQAARDVLQLSMKVYFPDPIYKGLRSLPGPG